jgi:hypothetical protein
MNSHYLSESIKNASTFHQPIWLTISQGKVSLGLSQNNNNKQKIE